MIVYRLFNLSSGKIAVFFFLEFSDRQGVTSWPPAPPLYVLFILILLLLSCTFMNVIPKFLSILPFSLKIFNTFTPGDIATRGNTL